MPSLEGNGGIEMQVNVFVTRGDGALRNSLLVVPANPQSAIPPRYREGWRYYCTVHSRDSLFGTAKVDDEIGARGFAMVKATTPDRR